MKKIILWMGLGAGLFVFLLIFGLGYLLYSMIPSLQKSESALNWAREGVFEIEKNGKRIEKQLSPECIRWLEKTAQEASLWDLFRAQNWRNLLPENCLQDLPEGENSEGTQPSDQFDLQIEPTDSEVI